MVQSLEGDQNTLCDEIDWTCRTNAILLNPKLTSDETQKILKAQKYILGQIEKLETSHVFLTSSGSSGVLKLVALSKFGLLSSAEAVNLHLQSQSDDIWINVLPNFHVGGLSISARSFLSGAKVYTCKFDSKIWDPEKFVLEVKKNKATLTSLVPTQLYDIVLKKIQSPETLRAVIIGGGALSEKLYFDAINLGWKILPSYGLTECASQVATAKMNSWEDCLKNPIEMKQLPLLYPLSHVQVKCNSEGFLMIKSKALLSGYIEIQDPQYCLFNDPKINDWLTTEDKVQMEGEGFKSISRNHNFIKIGGESVDMVKLEKIFEEERLKLKLQFDCAILAMPDERLGKAVHLVITKNPDGFVDLIVERFKNSVAPYEQIRKVHFVEKIPRSPLGKILKSNLLELL